MQLLLQQCAVLLPNNASSDTILQHITVISTSSQVNENKNEKTR